jgi:hypothetical protein
MYDFDIKDFLPYGQKIKIKCVEGLHIAVYYKHHQCDYYELVKPQIRLVRS